MATPITTRAAKGSRLTTAEMDANLEALASTADTALETAQNALLAAGEGSGGLPVGTTTDAIPEGSTNQYHTASRVRSTPLTGLSTATNAGVTDADTVISGIGKLQAQINAGGGGGGGGPANTDGLPEGTTNLYFTNARVRAATLTGLDTASTADVGPADTVLGALGKFQAKFGQIFSTIRGTTLNTLDTSQATDVATTDTIVTAFGKLQAKWNAFTSSVRGVALTGLDTTSNVAIAAADTILQAFGKLQAQVNARPAVNTPVTLAAATNLTAAAHANRQIIFNGESANLTIQVDATGGTTGDDEFFVCTHESSAGVPTLVFPDASTLVGAKGVVIGAVRKGADTWQKYIVPAGVFGPNVRGLVPAAASSPDVTKFLCEDGTFKVPAGGGGGGGSSEILDGTPSFQYTPVNGSANTQQWGIEMTNFDGCIANSAPNGASSIVNSQHRTRRTGAAAAISRMAGTGSNEWTSPLLSPSATVIGGGGFKARVSGMISDAIAAGQFGMGFSSSNPAWTAASEPSAMTNVIMLAGDSGDANLSVMHNDGSGACTKVALGANFPNNTNAVDWYVFEVTFNATGATRSIDWKVTNKRNGGVATGSITTNLPNAGNRMCPFVARGSANTATTPQADIGPMCAGKYF